MVLKFLLFLLSSYAETGDKHLNRIVRAYVFLLLGTSGEKLTYAAFWGFYIIVRLRKFSLNPVLLSFVLFSLFLFLPRMDTGFSQMLFLLLLQ